MIASLLQYIDLSRRRIGFSLRREKAAKGHVVSAGLFGSLSLSQARMAGDTDNFIRAQYLSGVGDIAVRLAEVDALRPNFSRQLGIIINYKTDIMCPAQGSQCHSLYKLCLWQGVFVSILKQVDAP